MTKKEFIEILKQVKESFKNNIYQQKKEILGLVDDVQLLPFNEISLNLFPYGYYWKDNNDEWRVNMFLNDDSKEQAKELENKKGLKFTNHRERAKIEEEINIIPSYEVNFEMKCIPDSYDFPSIIIDNKTIFEICINEKPKTMAERWNKTLLEHYKEIRAKKYETYLEAFYEWFGDKKIVIDSKGYEAIPLLYDEQTDHELSTAHNIILKQRNEIRSLKLSKSLTRGELTDKDIEQIAEKTRFKNGNLNYTALGKSLGITRQTARKMIIDRKLGYLKKPPQTE